MKIRCLLPCSPVLTIIVTLVFAARGFAGNPVYNWTGTTTNDAPWSNAGLWGGTLPNGTTDAWLNVPNAYSYVDSTVAGNGHQIIVGRSNGSAQLDMIGGTLTSTDEFYLGQYAGASGAMNLTGGTLTVGLNFTVGGIGVGTFEMTGGSLNVASAIKVNRYSGTGASGYADIAGGTVSAADLSIGSAGKVVLDSTTLTLGGNRVAELNGYLASGALAYFWAGWMPPTPPVAPTYDGTSKTTLTVPNGRYAGIGSIPSSKKGDAPVTFDYTNVRRLSPAPAFGVHPRIVCGPDDLPDIASRLQNTQWGQALNTMISDYTLIMRNGYPAYDALPASARFMPDNTTPRISNEGRYDCSLVYNDLASGGTSRIAAINNDSTSCLVLGGEMALEAFQCAVYHSQTDYSQRMTTLCAALDTWAVYAANLTTLGNNPWQFGNFQTALAYDFAYNYMTSTQQVHVRTAIAKVLDGYRNSYYGVDDKPMATVSNWSTLWSNQILIADAIEGEPLSGVNYTASDVTMFQNGVMATINNFLTYGWSQDGAIYEGMGKGFIFGTHLIADAKRGFDFFGNQSVRNFADRFIPALMQPYGYSFTKFDVLGGSGSLSAATGGTTFEANDYVGLKWMFPNDNAADFCFRNFINTPYVDASGHPQVYLDPTDKKLTCRSLTSNSLLMAAIFATDVSSTESWDAQRAEVVQPAYHDGDAGTIAYLSDLTGNATQLLVHMRDNFGGHTNADRNTFGLSALGRIFVNFNTNVAGLQDAQYQSVVDVDGLSMYVTPLEGQKCRIPEKIAGWVENANASFITGDATYTYSNQWTWVNYVDTSTFAPSNGYAAETNTFNTFRRSNAQIPDSHGNVPLFSFPAWDNTDNTKSYNEGIQKKPYNPMKQVYRTLGLVRGTSPYTLVVDDVQKDAGTHDYRWYASVPTDLSPVTGTSLPTGFNPATDVLLQESTGPVTRQLLVRVLQANGTPVQASGTMGSPLAYLESIKDPADSSVLYHRLVIERSNVVAPGFTVMLYPMRPTDPIPATSWNGNSLTVSIGAQSDLFTFYPRSATVAGQTVNMREFVLTRGGSPLIDYRNQIEPLSVR